MVGLCRHINRNSIAFDVYTPFSVVQLSEKLSQLVIRRGTRRIYQGNAVVTNLVNTGASIVVNATLTDPWKDLDGLIGQQSESIQQEASRFLKDWKSSFDLRSDVQLSVTRIRSLLYQLSRWVEQVDLYLDDKKKAPDSENLQNTIHAISKPIIPALYENIQNFEDSVKLIDNDSRERHRAFIQRDLHPLILRSPFVHRTFMKPLGYAGDYEMVNMMLRNPYEGGSTYYKIVNSLFLNAQPVLAHQNRIKILENYLREFSRKSAIEKRKITICNLGCGPAIEVQRTIRENIFHRNIELTLMDFNRETLDYTEAELKKIAMEYGKDISNIKIIQKSVDSILRERTTTGAGMHSKYDFVYCAGLFDYLNDKICARMLKIFFNWVKPGGTVLATNVHKNHDARGIMEYLMDWHLEYRDEDGFGRLFQEEGNTRKKVYTDDSKVNIFLDIHKSSELK